MEHLNPCKKLWGLSGEWYSSCMITRLKVQINTTIVHDPRFSWVDMSMITQAAHYNVSNSFIDFVQRKITLLTIFTFESVTFYVQLHSCKFFLRPLILIAH